MSESESERERKSEWKSSLPRQPTTPGGRRRDPGSIPTARHGPFYTGRSPVLLSRGKNGDENPKEKKPQIRRKIEIYPPTISSKREKTIFQLHPDANENKLKSSQRNLLIQPLI